MIDDHMICLNAEDDPQLMTLGEFLDANADGLDSVEIDDIREMLDAGLTYAGGGGAGATFTLNVVVAKVTA